MQNDPIVIVGLSRTPMGAFQGELKGFAAPELGAAAIRAAVERARIRPDEVQEVIMGCVLPAGQGQAPARQASLGAGLPLAAGCTTVNKMCGSGMKAAMFAHDLLATNSFDMVVAGGMESMTNAPYLLPKARGGLRMGHGQVIDHMFYDGLEDAYIRDEKGGGRLMGTFAEECAQKYNFSREAQDRFAITSLERAQKANKEGWFAWETTPIAIKAGKDEKFVETDEQPFKANLEKIPTLRPAFRKDGTVTAANSSSISDGAAAPSEIELELAAVTVPSFLNAGLSVGIFSRFALNGCSSVSRKRSSLPDLIVIGVSSQANQPSLFAFCALSKDRIANSSCASREKLYLAAQSSANVPIRRPLS